MHDSFPYCRFQITLLTKCAEVDDRRKKVEAFNVLVHKLPRENLELLLALLGFLIDIIDRAEVNKMTARNGKQTARTVLQCYFTPKLIAR